LNSKTPKHIDTEAHQANKEEILTNIKMLDNSIKQRITMSANRILRRHPGLQTYMTVEDLIQEGLVLALETRNWNPSKIDFAKFMSGVMRSFASNESRKNKSTRPTVLYLEERSELENSEVSETSQKTSSPEELIIADQENALSKTRIAILKMILSNDLEALGIFNLTLENKPKRVIRTQLGMTDNQYWAADRRLWRAINKMEKNND